MTVLLLSITTVETTEVVLHVVSRETDAVFLSLSCNSKTAIRLQFRLFATPPAFWSVPS